MRTEAEVVTPRPLLRVVEPDDLPPLVARARAERSARRVMATLVVSAGALTTIGLVMVLSASSVQAYTQDHNSFYYFERQAVYAALGAVAALLTYRVRHDTWRRLWPAMAFVTFVLLVAVFKLGTTVGGSTRWIQYGAVNVQPSEFAKFTAVAATAALLARNRRFVSEPFRLVLPVAMVVLPIAGLVLLQPDLGTTFVIAASVAALLFVSGIRMRTLVAWLSLATAFGLSVIMSTDYMRSRFFAYLHPWQNARTTGYQVTQGLMAIGSGHVVGVGLGASRQKWLFVPNAHTDFIFAILGEEVGLIGGILVLAMFGAVVFAGIRIAVRAPDTFGRLLATGITTWLAVQALVNLGGVTGVLPITGVPLPFVSYGGSSLIVTLAMVGVLASIGRASLWPDRRRAARSTATRTARGAAGSKGRRP
jgi:cell division protein FtsW